MNLIFCHSKKKCKNRWKCPNPKFRVHFHPSKIFFFAKKDFPSVSIHQKPLKKHWDIWFWELLQFSTLPNHQGPTGRFFYIRRVCVGYWKKVELQAGSSSVEIFNLVPGFPIYAWEYPGILGISGWCPRIPSRACQAIFKIARSLRKYVFCDKYIK